MWNLLEQALWRGGLAGWCARIALRLRWWEISRLPDREVLWRALYKKDQVYADGSIKPAFFRDRRGVSCDLARLSTREKSRRGYSPPPWPEESGLVAFRAEQVRAAGGDVQHVPLRQPTLNYAHCQFVPELVLDEDSLAGAAWFEVPQRIRPITKRAG